MHTVVLRFVLFLYYRQTSYVSRTKSQNLNVSRLVFAQSIKVRC